ncbi:hypothetical protein BG003_007357 [Podila horticola]|nr:hypothetical protein BG003_007357 [Podila horticola]
MSLTSIEPTAHVDQEANNQLKWDEFVQRVKNANLLRAQLEGQRPLLNPTEFRDMVTQYAFASANIQPPWFRVGISLESGLDARFETEVWELIYSNFLRQIDDMILLSEILEAEGRLSTISREDLIHRREIAIENRRRNQEEAAEDHRQRLDRENRMRLLEEEILLMNEKRRLLDEDDRLVEEEWRRQVEEEKLFEVALDGDGWEQVHLNQLRIVDGIIVSEFLPNLAGVSGEDLILTHKDMGVAREYEKSKATFAK